MPVIQNNLLFESCDEIPEEEGTPYDVTRQRSYVRRFLVKVKYKGVGPVHVCLCPGIPLAGSIYVSGPVGGYPNPADANGAAYPDIVPLPVVYDQYAVLVRKSAKRRTNDPGGANFWIVTCEYSVNTNLLDPTVQVQNPDNPELDTPVIRWDFEEGQEAPSHDLQGYPYTNSAKMPFSPPPVVPKNYAVLTITRNELNFNYSKASAYATRLNLKTFLNNPPGCVQLSAPTGEQKTIGGSGQGGLQYWRTTYRLKFRPPQRTGGFLIPMVANSGIRQYDKAGQPIWFSNQVGLPNLPSNGIGVLGTLYYASSFADSWQPTILNKSMYKIGRQGEVMAELVGKSVPIVKNGHPIQHPVIINWQGQEVGGDSYGNVPPWWIRFEDFGYADIKTLLVKGVG